MTAPSSASTSSAGSDEDRLARVALGAVVEPGTLAVAHAMVRHGPAATWDALRRGHDRLDPHGRWRRRAAGLEPERVLEQGTAAGLRFLVPGDPGWPPLLDWLDLTLDGPAPVPPTPGLWVRGPGALAQPDDTTVAVVGSRAATEYGLRVSAELAADLALFGWTVVSGAAFGIDQAAHRGTLATGTPTVAVLACGADLPYPRSHADLLDRIAEDGVVVSELPPGATPTRSRFLSRNRLIAGLSRGVVLVEAAQRSGALNTAGWAEKLGRPVAAIPGPVTSALSVGCHELVRNGLGVLAGSAAEVLDVVAAIGTHTAPAPTVPDTARDQLSLVSADVLEAVPGTGSVTAEEIAAETGYSVAECTRALTELTEGQLLRTQHGRWRLP